MIKREYIEEARKTIKWVSDYMIEQDMIISRALINLYNNPIIKDNLLFRGGTALNKIFLNPPARYSEDLDFVITQEKPVGFLMDAIRDSLGWLGKPRTKRDQYGFKVIYIFENVSGEKSKLKIETNCKEIFNVDPIQYIPFSFASSWFTGQTVIKTYSLEELMASKIRAVYQRKKGRDLFDAWYVFSKKLADLDKTISMFHGYNAYNKINITRKQFDENMQAKQNDQSFRQDIKALLPSSIDYNFDDAWQFFMNTIIRVI